MFSQTLSHPWQVPVQMSHRHNLWRFPRVFLAGQRSAGSRQVGVGVAPLISSCFGIEGLGHALGRHIDIMQTGMIEKPSRPWPDSLMPENLDLQL